MFQASRRSASAMLVLTSLALSGCWHWGSDTGSNTAEPAAQVYAVDATVSGLDAPGLVLNINGTAHSVASGATTLTLASSLPAGTGYSVTVETQPAGLTCSVNDSVGSLGGATGADIPVTCIANSYSVGGSITGLTVDGLVLLDNAGDATPVAANAAQFTMNTGVAYGSNYNITVQTAPPGLSCLVGSGAGTMGVAAVANVAISCSPDTYTVGGSISGLTASGLTLLDNGGDATIVAANAIQFTMNTRVAFGTTYGITVQTVPSGLVCTVSNSTDVMGPANVANANVSCSPSFTLLYSFAGGSSDGASPYHSLIQAANGDFYGTTNVGGASNDGVIFAITPSGAESILYSYPSTPYSGVIQGADDNFYGTTAGGGANNRGTVFKITPSGTQSILYSFPAGASDPYTGVIQGSDGNFYGTTGANGASDDGTVFKLTPTGTASILHVFPKVTSTDGQTPYAGLIQGSDGNFYGTTYQGGTNGFGTVFKVTPSGTETVLYSFAGGTNDGEHPYGGVTQGSDGNFYGTTYQGGSSGVGTVFEVTPSGTETILHSFSGGSSDGANPEAGVTQGADGNLYGVTFLGGPGNVGTIFKVTPAGSETILHAFAGSDGANPSANLVQGTDGKFYGSAGAGGANGHGTFFSVTLQ